MWRLRFICVFLCGIITSTVAAFLFIHTVLTNMTISLTFKALGNSRFWVKAFNYFQVVCYCQIFVYYVISLLCCADLYQ